MFPDLCAQVQAWMPELRGTLRANVALAPFSWFRTGGPAQLFFSPRDEEDLSYFLTLLPETFSVCVLSLGSNVLIRDGGVEGVVIHLSKAFQSVTYLESYQMRVGTALPDAKVARLAAEAGIAGFSFLRGIPGALGGAIAMNAGAYGREMKHILKEVRAVDRSGKVHLFKKENMRFTYRHYQIVGAMSEPLIFTEALLQGEAGSSEEIFLEMKTIMEQRQASQPVNTRTGGSTFKNPLIPHRESKREFQAEFQKAWQLIDAAQCRGLRLGGAQVSEMHCNFLLNLGNATSADLEDLGEEVRARVYAQSGIQLEWEIQRIGKRIG